MPVFYVGLCKTEFLGFLSLWEFLGQMVVG